MLRVQEFHLFFDFLHLSWLFIVLLLLSALESFWEPPRGPKKLFWGLIFKGSGISFVLIVYPFLGVFLVAFLLRALGSTWSFWEPGLPKKKPGV